MTESHAECERILSRCGFAFQHNIGDEFLARSGHILKARNSGKLAFTSMARRCIVPFVIALSFVHGALADPDYFRHVIFDNSMNAGAYSYSTGRSVGPSTLEQKDGHLPVEERFFLTPPNVLRISWQSEPGGGWDVEFH